MPLKLLPYRHATGYGGPARLAVTQQTQGGEVLFAKPPPLLVVTGRPEIAGRASDQPLAVIVDLDQRHFAVTATRRLVVVGHWRPRPQTESPAGGTAGLSKVQNSASTQGEGENILPNSRQ